MTSPKTLLHAWELFPKKQLGQNFLSDPGTAQMIVSRGGVAPDDVVFEIGAGLGALTVPLSSAAQKVLCVEKDDRLIRLIETELTLYDAKNVTLIHRDILSVNICDVAESEKKKLLVFGNLPYNISSQILIKLIESRRYISRCILMFQKELAHRLMASPGTKDYGRISVMLQYCAKIRHVSAVPAHLFYPKPKIDSEVVEIDFSKPCSHETTDEPFLFRVIKAAFSKRRKTLKNALSTSELGMGAGPVTRALESAGIDPVRRAETLNIGEFVEIAKALGRESNISKNGSLPSSEVR
jgi:16S rRNA (adenine1518-N6/adenine1519-N6)-dimethyltransferase